MKRKGLLLLAGFFMITVLFAQTERKKADIVVMMDTSGTVLPYYDDINKRVLNEINSKFIREGDMFHLISFNSKAQHEISQEITSEADLSRIISRFMLLYQLANNSDLLTAFDYASNYTKNLQSNNDEKILIIISDGIFNPPANSKYANYSTEQLKNKISVVASDIRSNGWKVYFVKLPFPDNVLIRNLDGDVISGIAATNGDRTGTGNTTSGQTGNTDNSGNTAIAGTDTAGNTTTSGTTDTGSTTGENGTNNTEVSKSDTSSWDNTSNDAVVGNLNNTSGTNETSGTDNAGTTGYNDISGAITDSLGVTPSKLNPDSNAELTINDDTANLPRVTFPSTLSSKGRKLDLPLRIANEGSEPADLQLESVVISNGATSYTLPVTTDMLNIPGGTSETITAHLTLPKDLENGSYTADVRLQFADNKAVLPQVATLPLTVNPAWFETFYHSGMFWIVLAIVALLLLLLLLILSFILRRKRAHSVSHAISNDDREQAQTAYAYANKVAADNLAAAHARSTFLNSSSGQYSQGAQYTEQRIKAKRNQSGMTEIYVFNQNRSIGKRNIHVMKPGTQMSVGGGKQDDFLIFLVRFPSNLAHVRYDGGDYHLTINKPKYFPYVKGNTVNNCIGKTITVVSDKGYHVGFTFREYEDPITNLNKILTSIEYM